MPFLTLIVSSLRPANLTGLLDNLAATVDDPSNIEVLVNADEGDRAVIDAATSHRFPARVIETPKRQGYYTLHRAYQTLAEQAAPESYFLSILSDEVRFKTKGWDTRLKSYIKYFDDDLFSLRLSRNKFRQYACLYEALSHPENFPVVTRRFYEITGGIGESWGPDSWHQSIHYFLARLRNPVAGKGVFRSIPVPDVELLGEDAGQGLAPGEHGSRHRRIKQMYRRLCTLRSQQNFLHLAQRVNAAIASHPNPSPEVSKANILRFHLREAWRCARRMLPNLGVIGYFVKRARG